MYRVHTRKMDDHGVITWWIVCRTRDGRDAGAGRVTYVPGPDRKHGYWDVRTAADEPVSLTNAKAYNARRDAVRRYEEKHS